MFKRLFKGGSKTYLKLLMLAGVLALLGGGAGTFATFNAQVTNAGNYFQAGTLFLHNTNGSTTCTSESATNNLNTTSPTGCAVLFSVNPLPSSGGTGLVSGSITSGTPITSITLQAGGLSKGAQPGDQIQLTNGSSQTDTFTISAQVNSGATSIPVESQSPTHSYANGDSAKVLTYTTYASLQLTNAGTVDAAGINASINPACAASAGTITIGKPNATVPSGSTSSITLASAATVGAKSGETITLTEGSNTDTLTLTQALNPGDTTLHTSGTLTNSYTTAATITYAPSFGTPGNLCSSMKFTIVETDSNYHHDSTNNATGCAFGTVDSVIGCSFGSNTLANSLSSLSALTLKSGADGNTSGELNAGLSRYFVIGVQIPLATLDNTFQNQAAKFGLEWEITQA